MRLEELNYELPEGRIAQRPLERRSDSRLLQLSRATGALQDHRFAEFPSLLPGDELLVVNNARVIPARLFGRRSGDGGSSAGRSEETGRATGRVEVFLTRRLGHDAWEALVRPGRKLLAGARVEFGDGELQASVVSRGD